MRKIKTKAELKGLAQVPHPSFTQVTAMIMQCHWQIAMHWDIGVTHHEMYEWHDSQEQAVSMGCVEKEKVADEDANINSF